MAPCAILTACALFQRAQIAVDGKQVFDEALLVPGAKGSGSVFVGQTYDSETPAWTYRIDDVACVGH